MIDWARIQELKEEFGDDDFSEVAALFFSEVETAVDALPEASDRAAALHFIKGCSLNLGLTGLADLCDCDASNGEINEALWNSRDLMSKGAIKPVAIVPQPEPHKAG